MDGPKLGKASFERIACSVDGEGWPSRECHKREVTQAPRRATGPILLTWFMERQKGYNPFSVCPRKRIFLEALSFTQQNLQHQSKSNSYYLERIFGQRAS